MVDWKGKVLYNKAQDRFYINIPKNQVVKKGEYIINVEPVEKGVD